MSHVLCYQMSATCQAFCRVYSLLMQFVEQHKRLLCGLSNRPRPKDAYSVYLLNTPLTLWKGEFESFSHHKNKESEMKVNI